jgi:hypothetical protein
MSFIVTGFAGETFLSQVELAVKLVECPALVVIKVVSADVSVRRCQSKIVNEARAVQFDAEFL